MNNAVYFSLRLAYNMLFKICHKGVFKTFRPLFTELSHVKAFFKHFLLLNDVLTIIKICSFCLVLKMSNFIVNNAYFGKT